MAPKYRPDGVVPAVGLVQALVAGGVVGVVVGYVLGFIGHKWMSLIILWPLGMGGAAGVVVSFIVKKTAIRNTVAAFLLGALSAATAYAASHHVAYLLVRSEFRDQAQSEGLVTDSGTIKLSEKDADDLFDIFLRKETGSGGFWGFIRMEAKQGSTLSNHGGKGINLGQTGTWILFAVELLLAMVVGGLIPRGQAARPFCSHCGRWYRPGKVVPLGGTDKAEVKRLLQADDTSGLVAAVGLPAGRVTHLVLELHDCPSCDMADSAVEVASISFQKKGKHYVRQRKALGLYLLPRAEAQLVARQAEKLAASLPTSEATPSPAQPPPDR